MNISGIKTRIDKVTEKLSPTIKTREITIVRQIYAPGVDAEGNSKPRKVGTPTTRTVILET